MHTDRTLRLGAAALSLVLLSACGPNPDAEMRTAGTGDSVVVPNAQPGDAALRMDTASGMSMSTDSGSVVRPSGAPGTGGNPATPQRRP